MSLGTKRILFAVVALVFVALTLLLLRAAFLITFDERDSWIGYLGLCLLLEAFYMAVHFSLKTVFWKRPDLVSAATLVLAAIVALPVSLIFVLLIFLVAQAMIRTRTETFDYLLDLGFVLVLLGIPAFFLWRHVFRFGGRAEQLVGPERREQEQ